MSSQSSMSHLRFVLVFSAAAALAAGSVSAQSALSSTSAAAPAVSASESSSVAPTLLAASNPAEGALPPAPGFGAAAPPAGAAQSGGYGGHGYHDHSFWSNLVYEAGGGFNGPTSQSSNYITWGGNFTLGAGYQFANPHLSALLEYQFIDDKLPGKLIAEAGAQGGHAHIWSFTLDPVYDFFPKSSNDLYATGGYGFYRKVSSFTNPQQTQYCYFYCGYGVTNVVVGHFSSNQGGFSIGGGYMRHLGGMYGDSKVKLFAEFRYLDVLTPAITTQPNGLGTTTVGKDTKLMPVTLGVRW